MEKKIVKSLVISVFIGLALSIALVLITGYDDAIKAIKLLKYDHWLAILLLTVIHIVLRFIRWQYYLISLNHKIALFRSLAYYLSGLALTMTPGKIGETLRSVYLKTHGISYTDSFSAFFVERLTDLLAVIILSALVLAHYSDQQITILIVCTIVLGILVIVRGTWFTTILDQLAIKIKTQRLRNFFVKLSNVLKTSSNLLCPAPLFIGLAIAIVAWAIQGYTFFLILSYINLSVSLNFAIGCYSLAILVGAVSFLPGGLGSTEAVMILLLLSIGITTTDATAATMITRVATLWFAVAIGLCALLYVETHRRLKRNKTV